MDFTKSPTLSPLNTIVISLIPELVRVFITLLILGRHKQVRDVYLLLWLKEITLNTSLPLK